MSTYSTRLKIELIGSGEQSNSWGNTTNNNFSQSIEQSIAGVYTKNLGSSSSPVTLTTNDGPQTQANNEARQAAIIFTGHSSDFIIQFPAVEKLYFLRNASASNKITAIERIIGNQGMVWLKADDVSSIACKSPESAK